MKNNSQESFYAGTFAVAGWSLQAKQRSQRVSFEWFSRIYSNVDPTEPVDPENPLQKSQSNQLIRQTQKVPILEQDRCLLIMLQVLTLGKIVFRIRPSIFCRAQQYQENQKKHQILCKFLIIEEPIVVGLTVTLQEQFKATRRL